MRRRENSVALPGARGCQGGDTRSTTQHFRVGLPGLATLFQSGTRGVPGGCRAAAVLSAERGQRRPAGRSPHRQQPLQRAPLLCCRVKRKKKWTRLWHLTH